MKRHRLAHPIRVAAVLAALTAALVLAACSPATSAPQTPIVVAPTQAPAVTLQTTTVQPTSVSLAGDVIPIFEQNCVQCHSGGALASGGLSLTSYDTIIKGGNSGLAVVPGDAANSRLVNYVVAGKMPQGGPHLPQAEVDLITAWVQAGAPNN